MACRSGLSVNARICSFIFHNFDRSVFLLLFHFWQVKILVNLIYLLFLYLVHLKLAQTMQRREWRQEDRHADIRLCGWRVDSSHHYHDSINFSKYQKYERYIGPRVLTLIPFQTGSSLIAHRESF